MAGELPAIFQRGHMKTRTFFVMAAIVFVTCACPSPQTASQLESVAQNPLPPPFQDPTLTESRWELVSIVANGTAVDYSSLQPVYVRFYDEALQYSSPNCAGGGVPATPMPNKTFVMGDGMSAAEDCGKVRNKQMALLYESFFRLTSYELTKNEVLLTGENVTATLVLDTPWATP